MTEISKYFITQEYGGYSNCKDIDGKGSVLPNCVGLAWGMFALCHGKETFTRRPRTQWAKDFYPLLKKTGSGFMCSKMVREQSLLWYTRDNGKGHVVFCWLKDNNGIYTCIESNLSAAQLSSTAVRVLRTKDPTTLYKGYQGCTYALTLSGGGLK